MGALGRRVTVDMEWQAGAAVSVRGPDAPWKPPFSHSSIVNVPGESTLRRDFLRLQQENKERSEALRRQQLLQEQQLREQEEYKRQLLAERQKRIEQQKEQRRRLEEVKRTMSKLVFSVFIHIGGWTLRGTFSVSSWGNTLPRRSSSSSFWGKAGALGLARLHLPGGLRKVFFACKNFKDLPPSSLSSRCVSWGAAGPQRRPPPGLRGPVPLRVGLAGADLAWLLFHSWPVGSSWCVPIFLKLQNFHRKNVFLQVP